MSKSKTRVQFDVPEHKLTEIDAIIAECGLATRRELFHSALAMLQWSIRQKKAGHDVGSLRRGEDGEVSHVVEFEMPAFNNLSSTNDLTS